MSIDPFATVILEGQTGLFIPVWLSSIWLAILLGLFFGPISYKSGEVLKVSLFLTPWTVWIYTGFWAISFPFVLSVSKRFS